MINLIESKTINRRKQIADLEGNNRQSRGEMKKSRR